jgi:poly(A) polymerase
VGAKFGVVLVNRGGATVEVVTFRSEQAYQDGRHPGEVRFETDPRRDSLRRDFTINALMLDPFTGEVIDHVDGRADLEAGVIRAIGDPAARFEEDHLRMLRAVRFAARFGFAIEPATMAAVRRCHADIRRISAERVRDELTRILTEGGARRGFELLDETGLLVDILPEVAAMKGVRQPPEFHPEGDVWTHTLMMLEGLQRPSVTLALGVLLHDVGKPPTFRIADRIRFDGHVEAGVKIGEAILGRLRYSNEEVEQVGALVANHMRFSHVHEMRESRLKRFLRLPRFDEHLELHRLDCLASHGSLASYRFARERFERAEPEQLRPPRLVTGHDLIAAGYRPGPRFSKLLDMVEDAQLEGGVRTREEAMALVRRAAGAPKA